MSSENALFTTIAKLPLERPLMAEAVSKRKITNAGGKLHRLQRFSDADMGNQRLI